MARAPVSIRVEGLNAAVRSLIALGADVEDLKDAFAKIARFGEIEAARFAPRRTGRLAGDIRGNRARSKAVITAGRARLPYAGPINYGWPARNIQPSHFMQRADEAVQPYALRVLEEDINRKAQQKGLT